MTKNESLRYPIGKFSFPQEISRQDIAGYIETISSFPGNLISATRKLKDSQLDTPYREGGWTLRQLIHHCADSHLNAFVRFKLAMTENHPTIKPYNQDAWANLPDAKGEDITASIHLLEALHYRWLTLLQSMKASDFQRTFHHPEMKKDISLDQNLSLYAWHCKHHLAHILTLKERESWE